MSNNGRFLNLESGKIKSDLAIDSSSGVSDASKVIRTDSNGVIDNSFLDIGDAPAFDAYDATGGVSLVSSTTVVFDTIRNSDTSFSHSTVTGETSFNVAGKFQVTYEVTIEQPSGNSRSGVEFRAQIDTGGGFADVPGGIGWIYSRQISQGEGTATISFIVDSTIGDKIRIVGDVIAGVGECTTLANGSRILITGFQGPTGSQGPAGSIGSAGALGEVQLSDGIGGLNSDSKLTYGSDTLTIETASGNDGIDIKGTGGSSKVKMENNYFAVADRIAHISDTDTYISFTTDQIDFLAGGVNCLRIDEATDNMVTFNVNNVDLDFTIEKNISGDAYKYDAGLDTHVFSGSHEVTDAIRTSAIETITSSSDTLDDSNYIALCDCSSNTITINLPTAIGNTGLTYIIKKVDSSSNIVTIDGNSTETIDGNLTITITTQYTAITVVSDGTNWVIV